MIYKKIVVTGIGMVTSLGQNREETWRRLLDGKTGIVLTSDGLQAPVIEFSLNGARSRVGDFAIKASSEALSQAHVDAGWIKENKIGCAVSQSKPILYSHEDSELNTSMLISSFSGWSTESVVKREFKLSGPSANVVAACATGIAALQLGVHWIENNDCPMVLVGAAEASLHPLYLAGFKKMGVLAKGHSAQEVKPFDQHRSGFAVGEGAAVLVLEDFQSALNRGVTPLAEVVSVVLQHSSSDIIRFDESGEVVARLLRTLLKNFSDEIIPDYINAHGTATPLNDVVESRGIRLALGEKAEQVMVSSTKAATGHMLGAAGAVEAALTVLALQNGLIPSTLNLDTPDPECDLDFVAQGARQKEIVSAMSLSYGFGGQMGGVLFKKIL